MSKLSEILKSNAPLSVAKQTTLNIVCTNNYLAEIYADFFKTYQISGQQYNVLRILRGQKGNPANLSTIQERMVHKNSNASRLIDKLLVKDLVERRQCPENRRKIELLITQKGLDLLAEVDPKLDEKEQFVTQQLTLEEAKTLNVLLEKLRQ